MTFDPRNYPVLTATLLAPVLAYVGGVLGLNLDGEQATQLAAAILAVGSVLATASVRSRRTLPDPDATKGNTVRVEPTTVRLRDDPPRPQRPDPGRPLE